VFIPRFHQPQPVPDRELRRGGELLPQVQDILARQNPHQVLAHADAAIKNIGIALPIR
jgi:hypothetical protein